MASLLEKRLSVGLTRATAARLAGCAPGMRRHPAGVVYWTRLEGAAREPKARLLHSMEAVATASMSLSRRHCERARARRFAAPPARSSPRTPGVDPGDGCRCPLRTCRWPAENVSLPPLGRPLRVSVGVPAAGDATAGPWRHRSSPAYGAGFGSPARGTRTCRCPRCLRRDWQSEASTSRSRRRGSLAGPRLVGAGRDERWPTRPPAIRTRVQPGRSMGAVAIRRESRSATGRAGAERVRVAGRRGSPGLSRRGALVPSGSRSF